jgi:hypothetical protein
MYVLMIDICTNTQPAAEEHEKVSGLANDHHVHLVRAGEVEGLVQADHRLGETNIVQCDGDHLSPRVRFLFIHQKTIIRQQKHIQQRIEIERQHCVKKN